MESDMHIFGKGRGAFLEFLRNLTPSVLFASVALFLLPSLDMGRIDFQNWAVTGSCFGCFLVAGASLWANISAFLEQAAEAPVGLARAGRRLHRRGHSWPCLLVGVACLTWRRKKTTLMDLSVAFVVIWSVGMGVFWAAGNAAVAALRNGLRIG